MPPGDLAPLWSFLTFAVGTIALTALAILVIDGAWDPAYAVDNVCRELSEASLERREEVGLPFQVALGGWTFVWACVFGARSSNTFPPGGVRRSYRVACAPAVVSVTAYAAGMVGALDPLDTLALVPLTIVGLLLSGAIGGGFALLVREDERPDAGFWGWATAWVGAAVCALAAGFTAAALVGTGEVPIC